MKVSLDHLPEHKRQQIEFIRDYILKYSKNVSLEYIILFGSYSTGKWVENEYRDKHGWIQGHLSDIDILVLTRYKKHAEKSLHWSRLKSSLLHKKVHLDMNLPPITLISHNIDFFNEMVRENYYFYVDILKTGTILYNTENYNLAEPGKLKPEKVKEKAKYYFGEWFESASEFYIDFKNAFKRGSYKNAAFFLHQATERLYHCFSLVFADYKHSTHDLEELELKCALVNRKIATAFPRGEKEDKRLFELLKRAYIDSRYKKDYKITKEELDILSKRVSELKDMVEKYCKDFISKL